MAALGTVATLPPGRAGQAGPGPDPTAVRAALAAAAVDDPLSGKMAHWLDDARPGASGSFAEIAGFIEANPDWPGQKALRKHAEEALAAEPDKVAADWLKRYPPLSAAGRVRAAELRLAAGDLAGGTAALRAIWVAGDLAAGDEKIFLAKHDAALRPQDDRDRLDHLLWRQESAAALRMLPRVPPNYRVLAEARLALGAGVSNAKAWLARVAPRLRADPGLRFAELVWLRRAGMTDAAAELLLTLPGDPVESARWAAERQIIARALLAAGDFRRAYRIVAEHGPIDGSRLADAAFLQGFIALRYLHDPADAFDDFSRILICAENPYALARADYWGAVAAAAAGKASLAAQWYGAGAGHIATFYGQLAAYRLGDGAPPHPRPEPVPTAAERVRFDADELVRATRLFLALGDARHGREFLLHLANRAATPARFAMLADLARQAGRTDLAIAVARQAIAAGMPLMRQGYPSIAIPSGGNVEPPLVYAIIRQESGFATDAVSRSGALGLMQLMPATALAVAPAVPLPFSLAGLTADGDYNVALGRAYLERLLDDFGGSYALAIAAYNAGPGRVRQWLEAYGDPRGGAIGMVDWIELIPIAETRHYVERVLEDLQVYRGQEDRSTAFSLVSDLAR